MIAETLPPVNETTAAERWGDALRRNSGNEGAALVEFQRSAKAAFDAARSRPYAPVQVLDSDFAAVRSQISRTLAAQGHNRHVEAARLLLNAEMRWRAYAEAPVGRLQSLAFQHDQRNPLGVGNQPAAPGPGEATRIIARLAAKGVTLALDTASRIIATPAGLLNDTDRRLISDNKAAVMAALHQPEVVA